MRYAPSVEMMQALAALNAYLEDEKLTSYSDEHLFDLELAVRGGRPLHEPPPSTKRHRRRRVRAILGGYLAPIWAGWLDVSKPAHHQSMLPAPEPFVDTGLADPPTLPQLGEFFATYVDDARHPA